MSYKPDLIPVGSIIAWTGGYFTAGNNGGEYIDVLGNTVVNANSYLESKGYKICDGSAVNDLRSPVFNGTNRFLPNLTDNRFLQGSIVGGLSGGQNSYQIATTNLPNLSLPVSGTANLGVGVSSSISVASSGHTHGSGGLETRLNQTTGSGFRNIHMINQNVINGNWTANSTNTRSFDSFNSGTAISASAQIAGATGAPVGTTSVATTSNLPNHSHTLTGTASASFLNTAIDNRPTYLNVFYIIKIK